MMLRSDAIGSPGTRNAPTVARSMSYSGPSRSGSGSTPKSAFRNGMRRVSEKTSSAAARTLHTIVPAMRAPCGRRKGRSRRQSPARRGTAGAATGPRSSTSATVRRAA